MSGRTHCPSCHYRLNLLAVECPVCGLHLARRDLPRPLLFQASALQQANPSLETRKIAIFAPALGRVEPLSLPHDPTNDMKSAENTVHFIEEETPVPSNEEGGSSFWPLVKVEISEALTLFLLNVILMAFMSLLVRTTPGRLYGELWTYLLPLHISISWAVLMVPLVLTGQTLLMGVFGLLVACDQPERRLSFSIFHLLSVLLFPISFLCLLLSSGHRTLAETLTGQEIMARPLPRMR